MGTVNKSSDNGSTTGSCPTRRRVPLSTVERRHAFDAYMKGQLRKTDRKHGQSPLERNTRHQVSLHHAVRLWPTPNTTDYKGASTRSPGKERPTCDDDLPTRVGGTLNPPWIEWLMGWPIGWTDLRPLGMGKFRQWLRRFAG